MSHPLQHPLASACQPCGFVSHGAESNGLGHRDACFGSCAWRQWLGLGAQLAERAVAMPIPYTGRPSKPGTGAACSSALHRQSAAFVRYLHSFHFKSCQRACRRRSHSFCSALRWPSPAPSFSPLSTQARSYLLIELISHSCTRESLRHRTEPLVTLLVEGRLSRRPSFWP